MTTTISLSSVKGGTGTTTLAVALAVVAHKQYGRTVRVDGHYNPDVQLVAGSTVISNSPLTLGAEDAIDLTIYDGGVEGHPSANLFLDADFRFLVIRNDYVSLRKALAYDTEALGTFDEVIVIEEDARALDPVQVAEALEMDLAAVVPYSAPLGRSVDAGVVLSLIPKVVERPLQKLLETVWKAKMILETQEALEGLSS